MPLTPGSKLGFHEIQSSLGAGGMGEVYRATDTKLGRDIALKVLPAEMAQDPERLGRFRREAKALAQLDHPNIVTIRSVEECGGIHFLTMQLVDGLPLDRVIPQEGLPVEQIVEIASALGEALAAARRAVQLAPSNQFSHAALASALFFRREFTAARAAAERAVTLNKEGYAAAFLGLMLACSGDWERGCAVAERSTQLNPNHPGWYYLPLVFNEYRQGHGQRALELALRINMPGFCFGYLALAVTYSKVGEMKNAHSAVHELLAVRPSFRVSARQELEKWWQPDMVEQMLSDLRKAGLEIAEEPSSPVAKPATRA